VAGGLSVGRNLIASMARVAPQHTYLCTIPAGLGYERIVDSMPQKEALLRTADLGLVRSYLFERFVLPRAVRRFRPDVLISLSGFGLIRPPCPQAILIHLPHLFYAEKHFYNLQYTSPAWSRKLPWLVIKRHFRRQLPHTQLVLCQTQVIERRLRDRYGYTGRTAVCPNAVSAETSEGDRNPVLPEVLVPHADRMKLLCLTKYYAHKNLEAVIDLFQEFREELADVVCVTTVTPEHHPKASTWLRRLARSGASDRILNVGSIPQKELAGYYRNCDALFLPTLLESFSGTYLEAMAFDTPILTSDLDFAHAVCGDAAIYFDPWDLRSMKEAIVRLRSHPEQARALVAAGRERLATFARSWDDIAREVICLLTDLAGEGFSAGAAKPGSAPAAPRTGTRTTL